MIKRFVLGSVLLTVFAIGIAQPVAKKNTLKKLPRPKLVVGLVVDQMRWDFLYRYYNKYGAGGFRRLLDQGFSAENTMIPYALTVTAAGHACVYTGSVPALNGIVGNEWYSRALGRDVYCVEDEGVTIIGGSARSEPMSPRNLWATTITDQLRLATNFKSKVVGISIKDRGSILPAGHFGSAYWYADNGNWVTSSYYGSQLPEWVSNFNGKKYADSFYAKEWTLKNPLSSYTDSDKDSSLYEGKFAYEGAPVFPHKTSNYIGVNYGFIRGTPYGNSLTLKFAEAALVAEKLGKGEQTDFLAVSCSSTDYVGHMFGPNSVETEDTYLRLDAELADFFNALDKQVGKGQWTIFLTADHGVAHVPRFLKNNGLNVAALPSSSAALQASLESKFQVKNLISSTSNYQIYLNRRRIDSAKLSITDIKQHLIDRLNADSNVLMAFDAEEISAVNLPTEVKERFLKGFNQKLSGDIQIVLKPGFFNGYQTGTTHGTWNPYDAHIPFVMMGWGVKPGRLYRETYMTDIAPTIAALLHIQMPDACIGKPVPEALLY
ncbi:MAG: alkaline phosphatase family protein [Bacteroidetes bacterium]|nr:MAG: alkaline phosphatase family protein [Bacteroidota bacterium]